MLKLKLKPVTKEMCEIRISHEPEPTVIRGNAMASGDPKVDKETEDWIESQLKAGNEWAWCSVCVRVSWKSFEGTDYLGCCSYESQEDFIKPGGYYTDMVDRALEELNAGITEGFGDIQELIEEDRDGEPT